MPRDSGQSGLRNTSSNVRITSRPGSHQRSKYLSSKSLTMKAGMETGNFGKVREAYVAARQAFPQEVVEYIWRHVSVPASRILDVGCGTGIASRQLAEKPGVTVIGCDVDSAMIEEARKVSSSASYTTAAAHDLPFASGQFDVVTAFSAFHWLRDEASLSKIQRVLKENGQFFVVNKNDVSGFMKGHKQKLATLLGKKLPNPKEDYDPAALLKEAGFAGVTTATFNSEERFSLNGALRHIQSSSAWSEVSDKARQEAINLMRDHIRESMVDGQAMRELEVVVVRGTKK